MGKRGSLVTFVGANLMAVRWKEWRMYFTDVQPTGIGPQRQPGMISSRSRGRVSEALQYSDGSARRPAGRRAFGWTFGPMFEVVERYLESLKQYPNPRRPTSRISRPTLGLVARKGSGQVRLTALKGNCVPLGTR